MTATIIPIRSARDRADVGAALDGLTLTQCDETIRHAVRRMLTVASPATVRAMLQEIIAECVERK